ncbi:MAG: hypothetical protein HGA23_08870, partial [Bacteroidales bacterium]|nr:hypothetical protein [Bacteroidales bacterium]
NIPYSVLQTGISQAELDRLLKSHRNQWIILVYHHLYENQAEIPHQLSQEEADKLFTSKADFEQQLRLLRNSDYWISSESDVFKYMKERSESTIQTDRFKNMIFLKINNRLDPQLYDQPLTIQYKTDARIIRVEGSATDGTYMNRNGSFLFNALPNKEITIEIIE